MTLGQWLMLGLVNAALFVAGYLFGLERGWRRGVNEAYADLRAWVGRAGLWLHDRYGRDEADHLLAALSATHKPDDGA